MNWPNFYPANCPPADSKPASGTFYRLVRHTPPKEEDFRTPWEEFHGTGRFSEPTIINCGLSVHADAEDSQRLKKRIGKFRKRKIAKGELDSTLGVIKHTPSQQEKSHHAWWVPVEAKPWTAFTIISNGNLGKKENHG